MSTPSPVIPSIVPGVRRLILAPIWVKSQDLGVLTIRGFDDYPFPRNAVQIADLLARQIGLYRQLITTIKRLQKEQQRQTQTWSDISHQLRNPVNQAKQRADLAIDLTGGQKSPFIPVRVFVKAQLVVCRSGFLA